VANVSSDFLEGLLTNYQAMFRTEFDGAMRLAGWPNLVIRINSQGETETFAWWGTVPQMQNVAHGQVSLQGLTNYSMSLSNVPFQSAVEIEREALERDRLDLITPRIQSLGGEAARHPGELIFNLFEENPDAYDGTAFFADTRTIGDSANIDNILTGTGTTIAQFQADLAVARSTMRLYQDDRGRVLNIIGNTIVIPPQMEQVVWQAVNVSQAGSLDRQVIPVTTNGILTGGGYSIIVNPFLTDANNWYLLHVGGPAFRPFIYQEEKAPVLESDTNPQTRENILKRTFLYSVYGRYNVGVTDPRLAIRTTNS
jgi:phage major head subunit gpT-like protein